MPLIALIIRGKAERNRSQIAAFLVLSGIVLTSGGNLLFAQATHAESIQRLAIECLGSVPATMDRLRLMPSGNAPYVRSALVSYWIRLGKEVFVRDSTSSPDGLPLLRYTVDRMGIEFGKSRSGHVPRTAFIDVRYTLSGPDSQVLVDSRCNVSRSDTLSLDTARFLRDTRFPETNVIPTSNNWMKRVLQPAVVIGAAAVGTFLFFNLRSGRSDG